MEKESFKTIRIDLETWRKINSMRGSNNCDTFESVIKYLITQLDEKNGETKEESG
jgi:hypothetical protein